MQFITFLVLEGRLVNSTRHNRSCFKYSESSERKSIKKAEHQILLDNLSKNFLS
jgi:hypothetical protein